MEEESLKRKKILTLHPLELRKLFGSSYSEMLSYAHGQ